LYTNNLYVVSLFALDWPCAAIKPNHFWNVLAWSFYILVQPLFLLRIFFSKSFWGKAAAMGDDFKNRG
jgi:hypothetical protein